MKKNEVVFIVEYLSIAKGLLINKFALLLSTFSILNP